MRHAEKRLAGREVEICGRVRKARNLLGYSQRAFAERLGITRARLASYEEGRAPLRYEIAILLCKRMQVNERWLATGYGLFQPSANLDARAYEDKIMAGELFSAVFDRLLDSDVFSEEIGLAIKGRLVLGEGEEPASARRERFRMLLRSWAETWADHVPTELMEEFATGLLRFAQRFERGNRLRHMLCSPKQLKGFSLEMFLRAEVKKDTYKDFDRTEEEKQDDVRRKIGS